ncbi:MULTISPECIES: DUF1523 family protein [Marichromatium]|uniref:Uncharacterized protein DUF1523 n=1 Tax=Marichromatium gracile TaxID=1048 RepID=A0A4R4A766_MARGR|nr:MULTISPECIES: DUF1523 family protein [Marichromatium]MBO8086859.1 DUF1523 family protein [Marichromatium sp.]MBK1709540.1 hypothetical protein [Marichromatium gracile]RNE90091.1 DUF1523 family protein [Marichromatium sp. AB31]RNE94538.1 DUF1523 family protein [Marichromatium sp. AB32]TCW34671.1 uncharacterized protein DUF1523 [Marichromatium gracile]
MKNKLKIGGAVVLAIVVFLLWLRWGPDSWEVQITGVTGDGRDVQYRIETVYADSAETLIFRNEDAGFTPPYFKFDSADLQSVASRITRECPEVPVTVHGYSLRISWLDMFPNATSIDAPQRCIEAPSDPSEVTGSQ